MWENYEEFEKSGGPYVWGPNDSKSCILHVAAYQWDLKDFLTILPKGINYINHEDVFSETPLHKVASGDVSFQQEKAWYLYKHGADTTRKNILFQTPFDVLFSYEYTSNDSIYNFLEAGCRTRDLAPKNKKFVKKLNSNLAYCKLASMALGRALSKQGKIHKDVIPTIQRMVWETRRQKEWSTYLLALENSKK